MDIRPCVRRAYHNQLLLSLPAAHRFLVRDYWVLTAGSMGPLEVGAASVNNPQASALAFSYDLFASELRWSFPFGL